MARNAQSRSPNLQDRGLRRNPAGKKSRMAAREETRRPGKPKNRPSRKEDRPGSQKSRHPSKIAIRETKNAAIQERWPSGERKRPPGSLEDRRAAPRSRGIVRKEEGRLLGARDSRRRRQRSLTSEVRQGDGTGAVLLACCTPWRPPGRRGASFYTLPSRRKNRCKPRIREPEPCPKSST